MKPAVRCIRLVSPLILSAALACGAVPTHPRQGEPPRTTARGSIRVSGYWTIDVMNRDGSIASHTEFENALRNEGGVALAKIIGGSLSSRWLYVELAGSPSPCHFSCKIVPNQPEWTVNRKINHLSCQRYRSSH